MPARPDSDRREFLIIGHRGACAHEPENSLRSVRRAIADGADMIEVDVRLVDGVPVVIHDDTVDRTTSGSGSVYHLGIERLRELEVAPGEPIPTLDEVLELTSGRLPLNIELKDEEACAAVCELISPLPAGGTLMSSFLPGALRGVRERLPAARIGVLADGSPGARAAMFALAEELHSWSVHPSVASLDRELVVQAHRRDLRVLSYTVRTRDQLDRVLGCGADGCFADDPAWVRREAGCA